MRWKKYFINGSVISEPMSWSQTPLVGINKVSYEDNNWRCSLIGTGYNFWQSDTFMVIMDSGAVAPILTTRRISIQLPDQDDIYAGIIVDSNGLVIDFDNLNLENKIAFIHENKHWLNVEVKPDSLQYRYFISKERI